MSPMKIGFPLHSYIRLESETMLPNGILRKSNSYESIESNDNERLKSWIEQPIPSSRQNFLL